MTPDEIEGMAIMIRHPELNAPQPLLTRIAASYSVYRQMRDGYPLFGPICRSMMVPIVYFKQTHLPAYLSCEGISTYLRSSFNRLNVKACMAIWIDFLEDEGSIDKYRSNTFAARSFLRDEEIGSVEDYFASGLCPFSDKLSYAYPKDFASSNALTEGGISIGLNFSDCTSTVLHRCGGDIERYNARIESDKWAMTKVFSSTMTDDDDRRLETDYEDDVLLCLRGVIGFLEDNNFNSEFDLDPKLYSLYPTNDDAVRPPDLKRIRIPRKRKKRKS